MRDYSPLKKAPYGFPNTSCATSTVHVIKESRAPASCTRTRDTIFKFSHGASEARRMCSLNPNLFVYSEAAILPRATSAGLNEPSWPLLEPRCLKLWREILSRACRFLGGKETSGWVVTGCLKGIIACVRVLRRCVVEDKTHKAPGDTKGNRPIRTSPHMLEAPLK